MIYKFMIWVTGRWKSQVEREEIYKKEYVWGNDETSLGHGQTQVSLDIQVENSKKYNKMHQYFITPYRMTEYLNQDSLSTTRRKSNYYI